MAEIDDLYLLLRAQTAPLIEGFTAAGAAGEELAAKLTTATAEITAAADRMAASVTVAIDGMAASVKGSTRSMGSSAALTAEEFGLMAKKIEADALKMEVVTAKAAASTAKLGTAVAAEKFASYRTAVTGAAVVLDVLAIASAKAAADFETSTTRLVTSAGEIRSNLDGVRQGILQMSGEVGNSAEDLSRAMYTIESGGKHGAEGLKVLRAAAEGAKAENADLKVTADAVTTALTDYHQGADMAALFTSKLVAATSAGKTTFEELAGSLHSVLPNASAAKISLDDILGSLSAMTIHGMSAQQAAQNLSDVINHMQGPTGIQAKELSLLHMSTAQLAQSLKDNGLSGTLQEISNRIKSLVLPGSDKVILDLRTALNGLSPAVRDLGMKVFDGSMSMKEYTKAAGALDPISAKQAMSFATLAGSMHRIGDQQMTGAQVMQNYSQALMKATGDSTGLNVALMLTGDNADTANTAINTVKNATTEAGNHVKGWSEIQGTFNQKMSQAKDSMGALAIQVGEKLLPPLTKVIGWIASGTEWLAKHSKVATALAIAIGLLAVGFTIATIAMWAMSATPVFWIIAAIVVAVGLLVIGIYELVKHWGAVWGWIKDIALDVWHWLVSVWNWIADAAVKIWNNYIVAPILQAWHAIAAFFKAAWHFVADPIVAAWHWVSKTTSAVWDAISGFFKKWWPLLLVIFLPAIAIIMSIWNHFHSAIESAAKAVWNGISRFLGMIWDGISAAAKWVWGLIKDYVIAPIMDLWHDMQALWTHLSDWLSEQWHIISAVASAVWKLIKDSIIKPIEEAWHQIVQVGSNIWHAISDAFDTAWNNVKNVGSRFMSVGHDIVMGVVDGVAGAAHWLTDKMKGLAEDALKGAKDFLGIKSPSKRAADEIGQWIPHGVAEGVTNAAGVARNAVTNMARGLLTGAGMSVPIVAVSGSSALGGLAGAGGAPAAFAGTGTLLPTASSAGGGRVVVESHSHVDVYLDGKALGPAQVKTAQRHKLRNGSTQMT